uniref:Uncharacterized protein n=1 Tax=Anguilla anguilla TaxID=7936 RepID=A0A0E9PT90_ANGAN
MPLYVSSLRSVCKLSTHMSSISFNLTLPTAYLIQTAILFKIVDFLLTV